ncbi:hypothetical protein C0989_006578 [Termitomyces sp. Mn162]|nr:hypothetical protein C0989_006578 [Termitomyces sp. Mn162]
MISVTSDSDGPSEAFPAATPTDSARDLALPSASSLSSTSTPILRIPIAAQSIRNLRHSERSSKSSQQSRLRRARATEQRNAPTLPAATSSADIPALPATTSQNTEQSFEFSRLWVSAEATERQYAPALLARTPSATPGSPTPTSVNTSTLPSATNNVDMTLALPAPSARHFYDGSFRRYLEPSQWFHRDAGVTELWYAPTLPATDGVTGQRCVARLNEAKNIIITIEQMASELIEEHYQKCRDRLNHPGVSRLEVEATINPGNGWMIVDASVRR